MSETIDHTAVVDTYLSMWNETDVAARAEIIRQSWVEDGRYRDPLLEATGYVELSGIVDAVHAQAPGHTFRRTTAIDAHRDVVRFGWELADGDGTVALAGVDFGVVDADGRLQAITGFFGELAPA